MSATHAETPAQGAEPAGLEAAVAALLVSTEALHRALAIELAEGESDGAALAAAFEARARAFESLRAGHDPERWDPSSAIRAALERVRALDDEMLVLGMAGAASLQGERHGLQRRRSAMHAQLTRDRDEPRLIAVKA